MSSFQDLCVLTITLRQKSKGVAHSRHRTSSLSVLFYADYAYLLLGFYLRVIVNETHINLKILCPICYFN